MRRLLTLAATLLLLPVLAAAQPVLTIFNWTDYVDPAAIERFERERGIRVRYDVFDSLETLEGRLSAGRSGYDIVVPTSEPSFARLVRAGALMPLDRSRIPNWRNLDAALMARVESVDPGNRHGAIYLWGTVGLGYRPDVIARLAPGVPPDRLDLLLKPENARRLQGCGLAVMDSATDVLPSILRWLGRSPDSAAPEDLRAAAATLADIRPYLRAIPPSGALVDMLALGEICVALTYSGDVIQAAVRAREAGRGVQVAYAAPRQGAHLWFDMLAIPADAPNPAAAHAFIDFLLEPEVMAGISSVVRYPNAVPESRPFIIPEVRDDPNTYPDEAALDASFIPGTPDVGGERARSRLWSRFKAGQR